MGAEDVIDQPRDIHGTPIYVGDRVAIATTKWNKQGPDEAALVVRCVEAISRDVVVVNVCDGFGGSYGFEYAQKCFLRLP